MAKQDDFERVLVIESAMHRAEAPGTELFDASKESLLALGELLALRRQWERQGKVVRLRGTARRPVLSVVREVSTTPGCSFAAGQHAGCLRLPPVSSPLAERDESFDENLNRYLMGASGVLTGAGFPDKARQRLLGALGELLDNVFQHTGGCQWALSAYEVDDGGRFSAIVADDGEGVLASYRRNGQLGSQDNASQALDLAVLQHRSCTGRADRGLGFKELMDALRSLDALVRVRSDDASLTLAAGAAASGEPARLSEEFELRGFVVGFVASVCR
ncbi:hypothetical protein [Methylibium rhizosphaerae]|uniref:hypothetical protein n=1 Tax=Methylibium rhizosphaerae TaxID=2570323 RepID=UPI00112CF1B8|nr:hypothetical protein [Methylibium rhizosphaerae]